MIKLIAKYEKPDKALLITKAIGLPDEFASSVKVDTTPKDTKSDLAKKLDLKPHNYTHDVRDAIISGGKYVASGVSSVIKPIVSFITEGASYDPEGDLARAMAGLEEIKIDRKKSGDKAGEVISNFVGESIPYMIPGFNGLYMAANADKDIHDGNYVSAALNLIPLEGAAAKYFILKPLAGTNFGRAMITAYMLNRAIPKFNNSRHPAKLGSFESTTHALNAITLNEGDVIASNGQFRDAFKQFADKYGYSVPDIPLNDTEAWNKSAIDLLDRHNSFIRSVRKNEWIDGLNRPIPENRLVSAMIRSVGDNSGGSLFMSPKGFAYTSNNLKTGIVRRDYHLGGDRMKWFEEGDFPIYTRIENPPTFYNANSGLYATNWDNSIGQQVGELIALPGAKMKFVRWVDPTELNLDGLISAKNTTTEISKQTVSRLFDYKNLGKYCPRLSNITYEEQIGIPKGERNNRVKTLEDFGEFDLRTHKGSNKLGSFIGEGSELSVFHNPNNSSEVLKVYTDRQFPNVEHMNDFVNNVFIRRNKVPFQYPINHVGFVRIGSDRISPVFTLRFFPPISTKAIPKELWDKIYLDIVSLFKTRGFKDVNGNLVRGKLIIGDISPANINFDGKVYRFIDADLIGFKRGGKLVTKTSTE